MKVLLLGVTGQIGNELQLLLKPLVDLDSPNRSELNLLDLNNVERYLIKSKPDLIINAAAWTNVDEAEKNKEEATRLNTDLPEQLSKYSVLNSIRFIHYSSDYVYSGNGIDPSNETSSTDPLNFYGKTKLEGDKKILNSNADYIIFRISWIYSHHGNNFLNTMLRLGKEKSELNIISDQIGSPTPARLIAEITLLAINMKLESGIYNLAPRGETSWYGFAKNIFNMAIENGSTFNIKLKKIKPITTKEYPTVVNRPLNSRMNIKKLEKALNITLPDWQSELIKTIKNL